MLTGRLSRANCNQTPVQDSMNPGLLVKTVGLAVVCAEGKPEVGMKRDSMLFFRSVRTLGAKKFKQFKQFNSFVLAEPGSKTVADPVQERFRNCSLPVWANGLDEGWFGEDYERLFVVLLAVLVLCIKTENKST